MLGYEVSFKKLILFTSILACIGVGGLIIKKGTVNASVSQKTEHLQEEADVGKKTALGTYTKMRAEGLKRLPDGMATPHYSVSIVSRRLNENSARIEFIVVSQMSLMSGFTFEIQPVINKKTLNGEIEKQEDGDSIKTGMSSRPKLSKPNASFQSEILFPVGNLANAVKIKWTPEGAAQGMAYTLIVPLEEADSANGFIIVDRPVEQSALHHPIKNSKLSKSHTLEAGCTWVFSYSQRCGSMIACCGGGGEGATVDGVECKIICRAICPRQEICGGGGELDQ